MEFSPPGAKRLKTTSQATRSMENVQKIMKEVTAISFPWDDAVPPVLKSWFETLAKAHNTAPEYIFMGAVQLLWVLLHMYKYEKPTRNL